MGEEVNPELETFRKEWQEEVIARSKGSSSSQGNRFARPQGPPKRGSRAVDSKPSTHSGLSRIDDEVQGTLETQYSHELEDRDEARKLGGEGEGTHPSNRATREPKSALEHYELAAERESQGNLGDSLKLYRKAYRLDSGVDRIYKNKYFPPSSFKSKPANLNPSNAPVTVPNPAHHSLDGPRKSSLYELITSFSSLLIQSAPPPTDSSPPLPCPISIIPSELLVEILERIAIADIASFARLSLVCKPLAYLIETEDRIWKNVCLGFQHGFGAMHYNWNCTISGNPVLYLNERLAKTDDPLTETNELSPSFAAVPISLTFPLTPTYPTYKIMFQKRPRLRFGGCYISTVNYIRPGASTPSQVSWNTPVHIVTYYRYLRFFRDGSCVSLLTTAEPTDVVHHLCKEHLHTNHASGLPSAVMNHALRGRWKLSGPDLPTSLLPLTKTTTTAAAALSFPSEHSSEPEGTVHIETLGVGGGKYIYKMELSLRSGGRTAGTRNNKLAWRGFWSYNKLTDDWAEFGLRNDRAFVWSRVGSYGMGE